MSGFPVITHASASLAHAPGLVVNGSKPSRELVRRGPALFTEIKRSLRTFEEAAAYLPHQAFLGGLHPRQLPARPWVTRTGPALTRLPFGEMVSEEALVGLLACMDDFGLITLTEEAASSAAEALGHHPIGSGLILDRIGAAVGDVDAAVARPGGLPIHHRDGQVVAAIGSAHPDDDSLGASVLLENLACKATGAMAVLDLVDRSGIDPLSVDYVISCSEEAIGDRYQRGGGNLAKAVAEASGLAHASGVDVKDFCAAPVPALVMAASLVNSGVFGRVLVVGGGSLPKLGMKFEGHLKAGMPIIEDVLASCAFLVEGDDGRSPVVRLDTVGRHRVQDAAANPQIMTSLTVDPLARIGLKLTDVDDFATELHNPEVTEPQGSGNVPERNYRTIAALAVQQHHIDRADLDDFVSQRGMPGYAPTQGHIASALCYLPHAVERLTDGEAGRVQLLAKGSLFLGRMTKLADGMSVVLERNPARSTGESP